MQCHPDAIGITTELRSDCGLASQRLNSHRLTHSLRAQPRPRVGSLTSQTAMNPLRPQRIERPVTF